VPEVLLPLFAVSGRLGLGMLDIVMGVAAFWIGELLISRVLFTLKIRDRPY
jgi:CDP-2,3-bis-(O-geranylgeranyl)-sn-glycerol synthase